MLAGAACRTVPAADSDWWWGGLRCAGTEDWMRVGSRWEVLQLL